MWHRKLQFTPVCKFFAGTLPFRPRWRSSLPLHAFNTISRLGCMCALSLPKKHYLTSRRRLIKVRKNCARPYSSFSSARVLAQCSLLMTYISSIGAWNVHMGMPVCRKFYNQGPAFHAYCASLTRIEKPNSQWSCRRRPCCRILGQRFAIGKSSCVLHRIFAKLHVCRWTKQIVAIAAERVRNADMLL